TIFGTGPATSSSTETPSSLWPTSNTTISVTSSGTFSTILGTGSTMSWPAPNSTSYNLTVTRISSPVTVTGSPLPSPPFSTSLLSIGNTTSKFTAPRTSNPLTSTSIISVPYPTSNTTSIIGRPVPPVISSTSLAAPWNSTLTTTST
ncbi:hypothetical protein LZ30DRAFT_790417, partial [Colletotrichum cereale]